MKQYSKDKLIFPIVILASSIILGGSYYTTQTSKQNSVERQQALKLEEEKKTKEADSLKEETKAREEKMARQNCYDEAGDNAREVLKSRSKLSAAVEKEYKDLIANNLYRKDDFDKYYEDCLSKSGLKR